jgi:hypothetical protein
MARTTVLRAQNRVIDLLLADLFDSIETYRGAADTDALSLKLTRLSGTLRSHFALEDHFLYPYMITSRDHDAAIVGRVFQSELCNIGTQFDRFFRRWVRSEAIAASFPQFSYEAGMLFGAIRDRNQREDRDLFPVADALGAEDAAPVTPPETQAPPTPARRAASGSR